MSVCVKCVKEKGFHRFPVSDILFFRLSDTDPVADNVCVCEVAALKNGMTTAREGC